MEEETPIIVQEHVVLEKFNGDIENGELSERITLLDGKIVSVETFDNNVKEDDK